MAGARIEVVIDTAAVSAALQRASNALDREGVPLLLSDIGEHLLKSTRDRAAEQVGPDGQPWEPLSPRYAQRKGQARPGAPILKFDNHMLGDQFAHQVEGDTLLVGTNAPYGAIQQFGSDTLAKAVSPHFVNQRKAGIAQQVAKGIPARPWLGVSDADADSIVDLTKKAITSALDGDTRRAG